MISGLSPHTDAFMAALEQRCAALPPSASALLRECAGLRDFLPRAVRFLKKDNLRLSVQVVHYLMGKGDVLPEALAKHGPAIPAQVKTQLNVLLRPSQTSFFGGPDTPEKTIKKLEALTSHLYGSAPGSATHAEPAAAYAQGPQRAPDPETLAQWLHTLTPGDRAALQDCAGLHEFLPRAVVFLKDDKVGCSEWVAHYLMGKAADLPNGLARPVLAISVDVRNILYDLLHVRRDHVRGNTAASEKIFKKIEDLEFELYKYRLASGYHLVAADGPD